MVLYPLKLESAHCLSNSTVIKVVIFCAPSLVEETRLLIRLDELWAVDLPYLP